MAHASVISGADIAIGTIERYHRERFQSLPAHVAVIDAVGAIRLVNPTWRSFAGGNGGDDEAYLGENYLDVCSRSAAEDPDAGAALDGVRAVLAGDLPNFVMEYPCHSPSVQRWFRMDVTPLGWRSGVIVAHSDITLVKLQTVALKEMAASVRASLAEAGLDPLPPPAPQVLAPQVLRGKAENVEDASALLGDAVAEAHYLAATLISFVKREDFSAKEQTRFVAAMLNQWATVIGADMFEGKNFFDGGAS